MVITSGIVVQREKSPSNSNKEQPISAATAMPSEAAGPAPNGSANWISAPDVNRCHLGKPCAKIIKDATRTRKSNNQISVKRVSGAKENSFFIDSVFVWQWDNLLDDKDKVEVEEVLGKHKDL